MALIDIDKLRRGFRVGDWEVLPQRGTMSRGDQSTRLEPGVLKVLLVLAQRNGDLVSRDELVDEVWGRPTADGPIDRRISSLRKAFGDTSEPRQVIETMPKLGYRLLKSVELIDDEGASSEVSPDVNVSRPPRKIAMLAGVVTLILALVWLLWPSPAMAPVESIAVLPFENLSGQAEDDYLVHGFKAELVQTLHDIEGLVVLNVRPGSQLADLPFADVALYGSLEHIGDRIKVRYTIENRSDMTTIAAGSVKGRVERLFNLQEQLAREVQRNLYPGQARMLVSRSRPADPEAYTEYLRGSFAFDRRGQPGNLEDAMRRFNKTIELDPTFGPAYLQLATAYALLPDYRGADLSTSNRRALNTVEKGVAIDPSISAAAGAVYGFVYHKEKRWRESQAAYELATNATFVDPNAFNWYSRMRASVGDLDAALRIAQTGLALDPASAVLNSRVAMVYTWLGRNELALEYFGVANDLGASGPTHLLAYSLLLARMGSLEASYAIASQGMEMAGLDTAWLDDVFTAIEDPEYAPEALAEVERASAADGITAQVEIVVRTLLGDLESALQLAASLEEPGEAFEMDLLFTPELLPLRRHPEFAELMTRLGVDSYWRSAGCLFADGDVTCPDLPDA